MTARELAEQIHALNNSRPWLPTVEEIEAVLARHAGPTHVDMKIDLAGANGDELIRRTAESAGRGPWRELAADGASRRAPEGAKNIPPRSAASPPAEVAA